MDATPSNCSHHREPGNKGKLIGQKAPFKLQTPIGQWPE
jgi:hypothetical protein